MFALPGATFSRSLIGIYSDSCESHSFSSFPESWELRLAVCSPRPIVEVSQHEESFYPTWLPPSNWPECLSSRSMRDAFFRFERWRFSFVLARMPFFLPSIMLDDTPLSAVGNVLVSLWLAGWESLSSAYTNAKKCVFVDHSVFNTNRLNANLGYLILNLTDDFSIRWDVGCFNPGGGEEDSKIC